MMSVSRSSSKALRVPAALFAAAALLTAAGCAKKEANPATAEVITTVYAGGDILTMAGREPAYAEALAVRDGKILAVGTRAEVAKAAGAGAAQVDLAGRTLLPGFIDGHSHLLNYADSLVQANLNPPPIGGVTKIADIIEALRKLKSDMKAGPGDPLIGQGYDQDMLAERRHPTAADLDAAFPDNPVILVHASGHMLVANSLAFKAVKIDASTPDPEGGTILRKPGGREPLGLVQEMGMYPFQPILKGARKPEVDLDLVKRAVAHYAANGYTTASEALVLGEKMPVIEAAADAGAFSIDVIALPAFTMAAELVGTGKIKWGEYRKGLKYAGLKIAVDGSPQGKTAYLTRPFLTPVPGCKTDCRGFPNLTQDQVNQLVLLTYKNGVQMFSHCNGDAAIDMMIAGHENAEKVLATPGKDRRTVIIHSQIMRPDQLDAYAKQGLLPSFFSNHVYYWGDVHYANLGPERAEFISPLASAFKRGIRATNHTDATVTPTDPMFLLWTSVNRVTREGRVLGEAERVTPYQGLQALTVNGAYEYFEEASKGTLEVGKRADFVVLDKNPIKVAPMTLKDIRVLETIKDGKRVYARS
ncbi:MAG: amidohydrolase [Proteobacteria bacterium]|nr:amidohydrolase [Pseudomonadota bacterium]